MWVCAIEYDTKTPFWWSCVTCFDNFRERNSFKSAQERKKWCHVLVMTNPEEVQFETIMNEAWIYESIEKIAIRQFKTIPIPQDIWVIRISYLMFLPYFIILADIVEYPAILYITPSHLSIDSEIISLIWWLWGYRFLFFSWTTEGQTFDKLRIASSSENDSISISLIDFIALSYEYWITQNQDQFTFHQNTTRISCLDWL